MYQFSSSHEFASQRELIRAELKKLCHEAADPLYVALNEAVNNAFVHAYGGKVQAPVAVRIARDKDQIIITVRHEGEGFPFDFPPSVDFQPSLEDHGRGLGIIRCCTDFCKYSEDGREIIMRKRISPVC